MNEEYIFIGVDIQTGKRAYSYAALNQDRTLMAIGRGNLAEVVAFAAGSPRARVCVNAPASAGSSLLSKPAIRGRYKPPPTIRQQKTLRVADYELLLQGVSPGRIFEQRSTPPAWMQNGYALYDQLAANGFLNVTSPEDEHTVMEGNAEASFLALLPAKAYSASTLEGRLQRQLLCEDLGLPVPDAMELFEEITRFRLVHGTLQLDTLHSESELNSLVLAYIAWMSVHDANAIVLLGMPEEGMIHLPGLPTHAPIARQYPLVEDPSESEIATSGIDARSSNADMDSRNDETKKDTR